MARSNAVLQRMSRARAQLGEQLPGAAMLRERLIADLDGLVVVYRWDDRRRTYVLEGEVVRVTPELDKAIGRYVKEHRP